MSQASRPGASHEICPHHFCKSASQESSFIAHSGLLRSGPVSFRFFGCRESAFNRGADVAGADRLVVINRTSIINTIPLSYRDKILRIPGVKYVTHNNWFGGIYQDEKNFFPQFVIDPENQRQVFPELLVSDDQWKAFVNDRQGAIVGARTAERFHWKIGDRIPIKTTLYGGGSWEFNLDGIYHGKRPADDETQFWFQWDYFEERVPESFKGQIGWYVLRLNSPDDAVASPRPLIPSLPTLLPKRKRKANLRLPQAG